MAQNCASCFAAFVAPVSAGSRFAGNRYCTRNAPFASSQSPDAWLWPLVSDDWVCRQGADAITGQSYSVIVNGQPGAGGAGPGYLATSATSLTIAASGSLVAATQLNLAYTAGARVRLTSRGTAAWMEGVVTAYDASGNLTFTADLASGSGAHTDWDINLAGQPAAGTAVSGTFTCGATRPIVVANAAVQAGSRVLLTAANVSAAQCVSGDSLAANGPYHVPASNVAGVSFAIDSANAATFIGTEIFEYAILN